MGKLLAVDLIGAISSVVGEALSWVLEGITNVLSYILKVVIVLILQLIGNVFSFIGYSIAAFILSLIDFIETIFRLLAGLEIENGTRLIIGGGSSSESSDLLVQLIRNDDIQQAFLAMCIVGVFLLVMTTIFQMIKVEYTTEGAKNAKGPILEKAFKGLANLMLIPILCIFGVFLGNQILGLLDTATKGTGKSPTIGGALFVAATGDARYRQEDMRLYIDPVAAGAAAGLGGGVAAATGAGAAVSLSVAISPLLLYAVYETEQIVVQDWFGEDANATHFMFGGVSAVVAEMQKLFLEDVSDYDKIDSNFINGERNYNYANVTDVSRCYNITEINYLLLIVGGCICIKCLYNVCFGMILRLYYCTALFILSPIVIGMSPVTDNMGKWRTAFIGKAISAYGVVISMNLFFTIIKVLLSIDIDLGGVPLWDYSFGLDFAVGIIKGIIVLGGCLMIEKWSKEFGAYFGAEDALSSGAAFAKETGELAKNAVKTTAVAVAAVAAGVMTAGAGSAAVAGIAGKVGMLAKGAGTKLAAKKGVAKVAGNALQNFGNNASAYASKRVRNVAAENAFKDKTKGFTSDIEAGEKAKDQISEYDSTIKRLQEQKAEAKSRGDEDLVKRLDKRIDINKKAKYNANKRIEAGEKAKNDYEEWQNSDEFKEMKKAHDDSQNADAFNASERMINRGKFTGALGGLAKRNGLISSVWGGLDDAKKEMEGYEKNGGTGAEFEAALASVQGERKDRAEEKYNRKNAYDIEIKQKTQNRILNDAITEAMKVQTDEMRRNGQKMVDEIHELTKALAIAEKGGVSHYGGREFDKNSEFYKHLQQRLYAKEDAMKEAGIKEVNGKVEVDIKGTDAIQSAMTKAIAEGWNTKKITDELTRIFEEQGAAGNKKLLEEILKAIEKVKGSTGGGK